MKNQLLYFVTVILFVAFYNTDIKPQSDYEITQNFKSKYKEIENSIDNLNDVNEIGKIESNIADLKKEFLPNKDLIDNALYPDDFNSSFTKLEQKLDSRRVDVSQIGELKVQVATLNDQMQKLNNENSELISEIQTLKLSNEADSKTIDSLKHLVAQLRIKIKQRDDLIMGIVDSLFQTLNIPTQLSDMEINGVMSKIKSTNLFENMKRFINDNIRFMEVTQLTANDLSQMKRQQMDLADRWRKIGPKIAQVYLAKKQSDTEINEISTMFNGWSGKLNKQIWDNINDLFKKRNISLVSFSTGDEFTQSVSNFINDEIKNYGVKSKSESERIYHAFTDSVYFQTLKSNWIPFLISNGMMTEANKDTIEAQIKLWKDKVAPSTYFPMWVVYAGVALLLIIIILLILNLTKKKKVAPPDTLDIKESTKQE